MCFLKSEQTPEVNNDPAAAVAVAIVAENVTTETVLKQTTPPTTAIKSNDQQRDKTIRELVALKSQLKDMFEERTTLRDRLQCLEQERKLQELSLGKYKETLQSQKQLNKDLLDEILQLRESQETLLK